MLGSSTLNEDVMSVKPRVALSDFPTSNYSEQTLEILMTIRQNIFFLKKGEAV
jgi:hypothetical protein